MAQCLSERGWATTLSPDGKSRDTYVPPDQEGPYAREEANCAAEYTIDPRFLGSWTDDMKDAYWEYLDSFLIPCLREHGEAPRTPLPARETFREAPRWNGYPYDLPRDKRETLERACPANPPWEALGA